MIAAVTDTGAGGRSKPCCAALFAQPVNKQADNAAKKSVAQKRDLRASCFIV
jgi:hypothetical protein